MISRRHLGMGVAAVGASLLVPLAGQIGAQGAEDPTTTEEPTAATTKTTKTVEVKRETLSNSTEYNGDLGFGESRGLASRAEGTITWLPEKGDIIGSGEVLWEIDRQPVIFIEGDLPMYRPLFVGAKKGDDVEQLERYLIDKGYGPEGWEADSTFNARTKAAVKQFQKEHKMTEDGRLEVGDIVIGPESLRVAATAHLGDSAGAGPVLTVTSSKAKVTLPASSRQLATFQESPTVRVVLPAGGELSATLDEVKATPADEDGSFGYSVTYAIDDALTDSEPVKVKIEKVLAADALTVPVDALLALSGGGYAVEIDLGGGDTELRSIEVIDFDDTRVAITGNVVEGDLVVVL